MERNDVVSLFQIYLVFHGLVDDTLTVVEMIFLINQWIISGT